MTARGLLNQNPGNIDFNPNVTWQGQVGKEPGPNGRFVVFKSAQYGIRAMARNLLSYQKTHGCKTIRQIINRWAPPGENNTGAYVAAVAAGCNVGPDDEIDVDNVSVMLPLVRAIVIHENGSNPYPDSLILEGLHMAGIADAKPKPLAKQTTFIAQVGAGASVVAAGATQVASYAPTVKGWADQLSGFTGSPIIQHVVTVMLTVAGGLTLLGIASSILKQRAA